MLQQNVNVVAIPKRSGGTLDERTDDELMLLSSSGHRDAFAALVRRHAARVLRACTRSVGDPVRGEELAQDVWLAVWNARGEYRPEGRFDLWLLTVTRNRIRNAKRDAARRAAVIHPVLSADDAAPLRDRAPSELDALVARERRLRVDRALERVPLPQREAVALRFGDDLSYDEIAIVLQTNESTARSRVFHGLRALRKFLRGDA